MLIIENCNSLSELRQKLIDGEEVRTARQEPCKVSEYDKDHIWYKGNQYISLRRFLEVKAETEKEPCEDAIRREDAINAVSEALEHVFVEHEDIAKKMINKLPSVKPQEPSYEDVIRREDALQALCKAVHKNDDTIPCSNQRESCLWSKTKVQDYAREIWKVPSVAPQPKTGHWIPVSKELPDKEGYYLCSVRYMYPPYNFFEPEKVKYMDDVTIQQFDGEFNIEVKAWMPLPLPWEGE